ncbi:hypothetical protein [Qipengyuania sp.]|uniref:hypothetical protein n=1 Tax=Qipengyuania sp. TaxID=2004515 RepID=UPI003BACCE1D
MAFTIAWRNGLLFGSPNEIDGRIFLTAGTISATLLGFSLATASFLISHTKSESMALLRESKSFSQLVQLLQSALWRFFGFAIVSIGTFASYQAEPTIALASFVAMSVATTITATTLIWSVGAILRLTR